MMEMTVSSKNFTIEDAGSSPKIGEIRKGYRVGGKGKNNYIWHACVDCGKPRWVQFIGGKPTNLRCNSCGVGHGATHPSWRGGRLVTSKGYIKVWISPDDFFYSMADKAGYVMEHRLVVAKKLGRCLQRWELVHHKDHNRSNNDDSNLQLVTDDRHKQITLLENRIRTLEEMLYEQRKATKLLQWQIKELREREHT